MLSQFFEKVHDFVASKWFLLFTLILFAFEASWLILKNRFPMAFDETYHFGLIQFFSTRLNPIVTSQPSNTYTLGAIVHNPSFLYHYLLSFPYRLLAHFTDNMKTVVIGLRFVNLAFAVTSLIFMRKLVRRLGLTPALANIVLLLFALTPIVTVLSSQINYDNLMILCTTIAAYETTIVVSHLRKKQLDLGRIVGLITLCLFSSLVKYSFLAVFVGIVIVLVWSLLNYRSKNKSKFMSQLKSKYKSMSKSSRLTYGVLLLLGLLMFGDYYGVNLIKYHFPVPQCNQVLNVSDCTQYYSWDRNYTLAQQQKTTPVTYRKNIVRYTAAWFRTEYYQIYAEIIPTGGSVPVDNVFYTTIDILAVLGILSVIINIKKIMHRYKLFLPVFAITVAYLAILWARNYHDYLSLGTPVGVQGRYVIPFLIYVYALIAVGVKFTSESKIKILHILPPLVATVAIVSFIYFGGFVRYGSKVTPDYMWTQPPKKLYTTYS